jgi:hypothetical protein
MGNPRHYSVEIPQRCLQLIDELWNHAEQIQQPDRPDLGPLTTTFLLSLSMPIINLPIERIERYRSATIEGYADDRHINPALTAAIDTVLSNRELRKTPFYSHGDWSFASYPNQTSLNLARLLPDDLAQQLCEESAIRKASKMPTLQWCSVLRNAMAHGGIAYLDQRGRTSYGEPVKMYAFASGVYRAPAKEPIALNVLRISEINYRAFLRKWVDWLESTGLSELAA